MGQEWEEKKVLIHQLFAFFLICFIVKCYSFTSLGVKLLLKRLEGKFLFVVTANTSDIWQGAPTKNSQITLVRDMV